MRGLISILILVLAAVAAAWALDNSAMVSVYWRDWRADLSLNLVLMAALLLLWLVVTAVLLIQRLRAGSFKVSQWRSRQRERHVWSSVLDGVSYLAAGRTAKAQEVARNALTLLHRSDHSDGERWPRMDTLEVMANWVLAESAHAVHEDAQRDAALQAGLGVKAAGADAAREGLQMRAVQWALQRHDWAQAQAAWDALPAAATKRAQGLRLHYRLMRAQDRAPQALAVLGEMAKLKVMPPHVISSWAAGLAVGALQAADDAASLQLVWAGLEEAQQQAPEVRLTWAKRRWACCEDDAARSQLAPELFDALQPLHRHLGDMGERLRVLWLEVMEPLLAHESKRALTWASDLLKRFPDDDWVQYVAALATVRQGLWGNAQAALERLAAHRDLPSALAARVARCQAEVAEQTGDEAAAHAAWKRAALLMH
jgi:HemY protein